MGSLEPPIPPHQKRSVDIRTLPGALPATVIPDGVDPAEISNNLINQMSSLSDGDLTDDALWRDSYGLCGTMRTFYSKEGVLRNWHTRVEYHNAHSFKLIKGSAHVMRFDNTGWITAGFTYETDTEPATTGSGFLDIVYGEDGKYRIWIIRTILYSLKGLGDVDHLDAGGNTTAATNGVQNGDAQNEEFDVAIVGGGQCGLSVGGRLQALGIKYVIFEKNEDNGDSWRKRYDSLRREFVAPVQLLFVTNTVSKSTLSKISPTCRSRGPLARTMKYFWERMQLLMV